MKSRFFSERKRPLKKSVSNLKAVFNLNDVNIISNPTPHDKLNSSRMKSNNKTITNERDNDDDAKRPKVGYSGTRNTEATSPRSLATQTLNKLKTFSTGNDDSSVDSLLSQNKGTEEMSTYSSESEDVPMTLSTPESSSSKYTPESSSSKYIPESSSSKYTPLELQVVELKRKYPGMILLVQNAYKYTFFGEDAQVWGGEKQIAGKVLNICTTMYNNFLTAVIPTMRLHVHLRRLVEEGHKVGVVNQVESSLTRSTSENKNIVFNRQLVGVYSKATLIGDDILSEVLVNETCTTRTQ
uniref:DNA mismatch repair protein MutS-like N-terminal domain-containing protein n=1 Tax=Timema monikensis TaxID=170555 RepID=A0A7R9EMM2_9NEOP|nr:unnamed protein product [Timema monikensis]